MVVVGGEGTGREELELDNDGEEVPDGVLFKKDINTERGRKVEFD
jgi:hypothetical protein